MRDLFEAIINSPHYSFGWVFLALLCILPAIVSVNLVQHEISKLFRREKTIHVDLPSLLKNTLILLASISVISYAFYLYVWK